MSSLSNPDQQLEFNINLLLKPLRTNKILYFHSQVKCFGWLWLTEEEDRWPHSWGQRSEEQWRKRCTDSRGLWRKVHLRTFNKHQQLPGEEEGAPALVPETMAGTSLWADQQENCFELQESGGGGQDVELLGSSSAASGETPISSLKLPPRILHTIRAFK